MDTCSLSHIEGWCQTMVEKWGFWLIKRANSSAWIHSINLRLKSIISGIFRTDMYRIVWNISGFRSDSITPIYCIDKLVRKA